MRLTISILVSSILLLNSCNEKQEAQTNTEINNNPIQNVRPIKYATWLDDPENGYSVVKNVSIVTAKVKYIPNELLIRNELKEIGDYTAEIKDSITELYINSKHFELELQYNPNKASGDIAYHKSKNYEDYKENVMYQSFEIQEFVSLQGH